MPDFLKNKFILGGVSITILVLIGVYIYYNSETRVIERLAKDNPRGQELAQTIEMAKGRLATSDKRERIQALLDIGVAKTALEDLRGAIEAYQEILKIDPAHNIAHNNLASIYITQGRYEKAETEYLAIIATQPHITDSYLRLAELYQGYLKDKESMVPAVLTYAINQNGKHPAFLERLVQYYFDKQLYALAAEQADELLKIDLNNAFAKDILSQIEAKS